MYRSRNYCNDWRQSSHQLTAPYIIITFSGPQSNKKIENLTALQSWSICGRTPISLSNGGCIPLKSQMYLWRFFLAVAIKKMSFWDLLDKRCFKAVVTSGFCTCFLQCDGYQSTLQWVLATNVLTSRCDAPMKTRA